MNCEICGIPLTEARKCKICGRIVCKNDYDEENKICKICVLTLCERCKKYLAIGYCQYCEKLICEDCAIKVNASYLCKDCHAKVLKSVD